MSLAERLKKTRKEQGISQAQIANFVGVTQGSIALIEDGTTKRSAHISKIAEYLGVSPSWLEYGEGKKENEGITLQPNEKLLLANYRALNIEDQKVVQKIISAFNKQTYGNQ